MSRNELFTTIPHIITGYRSIDNPWDKWFTIKCAGCVFPEEINRLRKLCYVAFISYNVSELVMEIQCSDLDD